MKEFKVTKERILDACRTCEDARDVLEAMFPEAFRDAWENITEEIEWKADGSGKYYLVGLYEGKQVAYWYASEGIKDEGRAGFKLEIDSNVFRILKRNN